MFVDHGALGVNRLEYQRRPEPPSLPVQLGPRPVALAGREELLAELDRRLTDDEHSGPRIVALYGLGGAGKTSVALEYAHRHVTEVAVCWQFAAEDPTVLAAQFAELAAQLGAREPVDIRDPVASVHAVLARAETAWLLLFDNVTDRASVLRFLPPAGRGRVLITTQNQHWPPGQALDVPVLDVEAAAGFLVSRTGDTDRVAARELAAAPGGPPLALEQAAAYMQASGTPLSRYLTLFRARQADLLAHGEATEHPRDVAATLGLGLSRLAHDAPDAVALLRLLAFLAPEPVPLALLLDYEGTDPTVTGTLGSLTADQVAAGEAVAALRRYSLVTLATDEMVLVHRLVQAITRDQLSADQSRHWKQAAATLVEAAIPADPELPATWPMCAALLPHALAVLDLTRSGTWGIARALGYSGNYQGARDLFQQIAIAHEEDGNYGPEHSQTAYARSNYARWVGQAGDAIGARDLYTAVLAIEERILDPEHPESLISRGNVAHWSGEAGDVAGARDQYVALLPVIERVLGHEHRETLIVRANIASLTGETGDAAAARDQFVALLTIEERVLGPEHPGTLNTRANVGYWTGRTGDTVAARDQYAALLPIQERLMGPEHPETLTTRANLAYWTGQAGDPTGARDQYAALLPLRERVLGPAHPTTIATRASLARWTEQAGG